MLIISLMFIIETEKGRWRVLRDNLMPKYRQLSFFEKTNTPVCVQTHTEVKHQRSSCTYTFSTLTYMYCMHTQDIIICHLYPCRSPRSEVKYRLVLRVIDLNHKVVTHSFHHVIMTQMTRWDAYLVIWHANTIYNDMRYGILHKNANPAPNRFPRGLTNLRIHIDAFIILRYRYKCLCIRSTEHLQV